MRSTSHSIATEQSPLSDGCALSIGGHMSDRYTWIGFYSEFADALLEFKDRRQELLERIISTYQ